MKMQVFPQDKAAAADWLTLIRHPRPPKVIGPPWACLLILPQRDPDIDLGVVRDGKFNLAHVKWPRCF